MLKARLSMCFAAAWIVVLATLSGGVTGPLLTSEEPPSQEGSLDPKSNPLAIIYSAYRDSGYAPERAIAIASRAMGHEYPDVAGAPAPAPGSVLLDPKSNPLAILYSAYRDSGWSPERATEIAREALDLEDGPNCSAYLVHITHCGGTGGGEQQLKLYLDGRCYEDPDGNPFTADGLDICDIAACLPPNQYRWLSLTVGTGCAALPPTGTCIQMRVEAPAVSIPCDKRDLFCGCFAETTPIVDCTAIEQCCCSSLVTGCSGCPVCATPCPNP